MPECAVFLLLVALGLEVMVVNGAECATKKAIADSILL
jgi:hypothetical protein